MKRNILIVLGLLLTMSSIAQEVKIGSHKIVENSSQVTVSFTAEVAKLRSNEKLTITPVLYAGKENKPLNPIVLVGRKKAISEKRMGNTDNEKIKKGETLPYTVTIPYESWMSEVSLRIDRKVESCCREWPLASMSLVAGKLIYYDLKPVFDSASIKAPLTALEQYDQTAPFLYSAKDYALRYEIFEKQREKGALIVYFEQGYSSIDPLFKGNQNTLRQVNKVLDMIEADPNASLKKIVIVGLASPEGTLAKNDVVAEKRANSLKYFVGERVKYDPNLFEIINGSEDWDGLKKLVEESHMPGRWQVLEIMEKYSIRAGRELELMKLNRGDPYRYMMQHFFPQLRNAGYVQIYYDTKPNVVQQQQIANINAGIDLIKEGKYNEALTALSQVTDQKRVANSMGVCYMMIGDYAKAEEYFNQAVVDGNQDAVENLNRIKTVQSITK